MIALINWILLLLLLQISWNQDIFKLCRTFLVKKKKSILFIVKCYIFMWLHFKSFIKLLKFKELIYLETIFRWKISC